MKKDYSQRPLHLDLRGWPLQLYNSAVDYLAQLAKRKTITAAAVRATSHPHNLADVCEGIIDCRSNRPKKRSNEFYLAGIALEKSSNSPERNEFLNGIVSGCTGRSLQIGDTYQVIGWILGVGAREEMSRRLNPGYSSNTDIDANHDAA